MTDKDENGERRGLRLSYEINLGHILQAAMVACAAILFIVTGRNTADQAVRDVASLKESMYAQNTEIKAALTSGLADVRQQISSLPDQRARLDQVERRLNDLDGRVSAQDQRTGALEKTVFETRADVNALTRAANMPLPRPPR